MLLAPSMGIVASEGGRRAQRISCAEVLRGDAPIACGLSIQKEGVHEIGTVLEGGPGQGTGGRARKAQRISCSCMGMLLACGLSAGGGRRAKNWHSEFRAQRGNLA